MSNIGCGVKRRQNIPQPLDVFWVYAARVVVFEESFQSLVPDCLYHHVP